MQILDENNDGYYSGDCRVPPSYQRNGSICLSPSLLIDSLSRKSISYSKLPQEPLNLTVLKLDGTSFEIEVAKNGTVADLKQAVEAAFRHLPTVSWSHVWGHFCLCYDSQKLLTDTDSLGCYGMRDGDQLKFIRHVSNNYHMRRTSSERELPDLDESAISHGCEGERVENHQYQEERVQHYNSSEDDDNDETKEEDNGVGMTCEYRMVHLFRGWFSYRKLSSSDLSSIEQQSRSSKLSNSFLGSFKNVMRLYSNKYDSSQRETWKAE